jgi:hypothetical protein
MSRPMTLKDNLTALESTAASLKANRDQGPFQNDIYEAVDDLCHLGQRAANHDTRVNYPARAESDLKLFTKLRYIVSTRTEDDQKLYLSVLDQAENLLHQIAQTPLPANGHLGVLKAIRIHFEFLFSQYGFIVSDEQPTGVILTHGRVVAEVSCATLSCLSFALSRTDLRQFWIEDLLYLYADPRYRSVPRALSLNSESDVDQWLRFLSGVLRQYGDELLRDEPGAFEQLAHAQSQRDAEYAAEMNAKYGSN